MTFLKTLTLFALVAAIPLTAAAQQADMDHSQMEQGQMTHNHNHGDMVVTDTDSTLPNADGTLITAKVNGLVCDFCAQALKKVFKKQAAVETLNVDLDTGEVGIYLKNGQTLDDETVKKLIRKSGYSLVSISRTGGA